MRQIRVQDATNRFIRQRLAISLRQEVPFGQRCQSYICRRTHTPDSVGCIHFGNPTPMRLCLRKELLASSPISVSTVTRFFTTPYPINSTAPSARPFLVPRYRLEKSGLAYRLRYFTLTRRTNEVSAPSGVIATLALPSAVQVTLTVRPSEENSNSFNSAAQTAAEMPSSLEILSGAMLTSRLKRRLAVIIRQNTTIPQRYDSMSQFVV